MKLLNERNNFLYLFFSLTALLLSSALAGERFPESGEEISFLSSPCSYGSLP